MAQPPNLERIRDNFLNDVISARKLVAAVRPLTNINPQGPARSLHTKQVYRIVELAFLGVVSEWESFLEETFVRYLKGAQPKSGTIAQLSVGKASNIGHSYRIISQDSKYDPSKNYLKFGDPKWTLDRATFFFVGGHPYSALKSDLARLQEAASLRNRAAHSSEKCKGDFKKVALSYLMPTNSKLTQGYRLGELLSEPASRHFGAAAQKADYIEAFFKLYDKMANKIVP